MRLPSPREWLPGMGLRVRLILFLFTIILLIQVGQILMTLAREVNDLDNRIATQGTIIALGIASSCVPLVHGNDRHRFDATIERVERSVELTELAIVDANGTILGHTEQSRIGEQEESSFGLFRTPRPNPGFVGLFRGYRSYQASAPIVRGTAVLGFVRLSFRSREVTDRAISLIASAAGVGSFWLIAGAVVGSLYLRRVTRPLVTLTDAVIAIRKQGPGAVSIPEVKSIDELGVLQNSFAHLLEALRAEQDVNARLLEEQNRLNLQLQTRVDEVTADLQETTTYLQTVIRCIEEGIITCDKDGVIVRANRGAYEQLRGLGKPDPDTNIEAVVAEGQQVADAVREALTTGAKAQVELVRLDEEAQALRQEGVAEPPADLASGASPRTVVFRAYPLREVDGDPFGAVVTVTDETEKRQVESRLRRHDRLVSLGTIAAGLAHELGNYMHAISGFSSVALRSLAPDSPIREDLEAIHEENGKAVGLLERFLQFARPSSIAYRPAPLASLVRQALAMCAYKIREAGVEVVDQLEVGSQEVVCDRRLLNQVFVNLVLNAIDAVTGRERPRIELSARVSDTDEVEVTIEDNGTGVHPSHLDRIFDPFFTTKAVTGTGLGLSIAHRIVDRHNGAIKVKSRHDVGTAFTVVLPIAGPKGAQT